MSGGVGEEIQLAHPLKTKTIASATIKTDRIDATILAHLGRADLVPQAYIPPREVRDLREILRHRAFLVYLQTAVKNRIHSSLSTQGLEPPFTDLFGKSGLAWLRALEIREPYRSLLDQDLRILESLRQEIKKVTQTIEALAEEDPRVRLILPIRGLGKYSVCSSWPKLGMCTGSRTKSTSSPLPGSARPPSSRGRSPTMADSPSRGPSGCAGSWWRRHSTISGLPEDWETSTGGSSGGGDPRSRKSSSLERFLRASTTA